MTRSQLVQLNSYTKFSFSRLSFIITAMPKKLRWGVLGTASIGLRKVILAMQQGEYSRA